MKKMRNKIVGMMLASIVLVSVLPFNVLAKEVGQPVNIENAVEGENTDDIENTEAYAQENDVTLTDTENLQETDSENYDNVNEIDEQEENGEDPLAGRANGYIDSGFFDSSDSGIALYNMSQPQLVHNSKFDNDTKRIGIDVSSYQENIDWNRVKASGVEFAIIRVAYRAFESGTLGIDRCAIKNIEGASNAGIKVGVYIFSQAITVAEAQEEADYIVNQVKNYNISLPISMDYEYVSSKNGLTGRLYNANLSKEDATAIVNAFCDRVQSRGYTSMVYANKNMFNENLYSNNIDSKYLVWLANYTNKTTYNGKYSFWQYTDKGTVDGISGNVDMDVWYDNGTISNGFYSVCDGIYTISSRLDETKVVDISDGSKANGGNVQLYQYNGTNAQKFRIHYIGNGYYTLTNVNSQKVVDVAGGRGSNGTNIQQYAYNNSFSQKWIIKSTGNGYYKIVSSINGKCFDVAAANAKNGANIQLYSDNGTSAQQFKLKLVDAGQSLANGVYKIATKANTNMVLDIAGGSTGNGGNVQLYSNNESDAQKWIVNYLGDGYYEIAAFNSGKALDIYGNGCGNGSNVQIYNENNTIAQKWIIRDTGDGYFYIISANSGNYLDIKSGIVRNGQNVQMYSPNGSNAQKFKFISVAATNIPAGPYYLQSALNYGYVVDITAGSRSLAANSQLYKKNNTNAQKFYIYGAGNGSYIIKNVNSNLVLDVAAGSRANAANIQQYSYNATNAQKWILVPCGNGQYTFVNVGSGKCLEITFGLVKDGSNIEQYYSNRTGAQKFMLQLAN